MSDKNNNNKIVNNLANSNNSETLYNVIQNKRQTSRNHITNNNISSNKPFSLNLDDSLNNTSVFNLNRSGSPCLPNFGSLKQETNFNAEHPKADDTVTDTNNFQDMNFKDVGKKKKNSITEIVEGNLLVQHEWPTDEDEDSDVQSKGVSPRVNLKFNMKPMCKKATEINDKKTWINIDPNHLSGMNDMHNNPNSLLRLNTTIPLDESDTLSDYNSAGYEIDEMRSKDIIKNNLNYLKQNKEVLYNKYSNINKREDKRIKLGMGYSSYRKKLTTCEYQSKQEYLKDELKYKRSKMFSLSMAKKSCNFKRNRYSDISPYNYNRIILNVQKDKETGSLSNDYINASKVILDCIDPKTPETLIATQGPTKNTYKQFWQMVYDQSSEAKEVIIVMVTPLVENGREKCYPYWPSKKTSQYVQWNQKENLIPREQMVGHSSSIFNQDLNLKIVKDEEQVSSHYYTVLELENLKVPDQKIKVHHLYYDKWEDFSSPTSISQVLDLIKHTNSLRKNKDLKIISHCSAGVGRTGTFFALYYLYNSFKNKSLKDSALSDPVESTVSQLRRSRMKMVQTFEQFKFIYEVVRHLYEEERK
ncbi:hypothetical protein FOG48_02372 [Hanseniaspora uvarum]|nr:hypothetical protein FOG48_02372 [Hanseniaspora uvarum]